VDARQRRKRINTEGTEAKSTEDRERKKKERFLASLGMTGGRCRHNDEDD
jgi:hypothetical protein